MFSEVLANNFLKKKVLANMKYEYGDRVAFFFIAL